MTNRSFDRLALFRRQPKTRQPSPAFDTEQIRTWRLALKPALKDSMEIFNADGRMPKGAPEFVLSVLKPGED